jgi:predicted nucleic acid-binding protein
MRICIDSGVFIRGLEEPESDSAKVLEAISIDVELAIPRLVTQEVSRNLAAVEQVRAFYRLFHERKFATIIDEPVPRDLVQKYFVQLTSLSLIHHDFWRN